MLHVQVIVKQPSSDNTPYEKIGDEVRSLADEVPFDIPDSWEWVRLGTVIELQSGQDMTPDKYNDCGKGIPYITGASNIENGNVLINRWTEYGRAFAYCGDILLTCKGTVGTMAVLQEPQVHIARQIMAIRPISELYVPYIQLVLDTLVENLKAAAKSMIPGIAREDVLQSLFPVPPVSEQKRIVQKVSELSPCLEQYAAADTKLLSLNAAFPEALKKSILQEAVQGKLVPQDPSDEPAEALLERIRAEKQRLIKEGKIKKDKHESIIFRRDNSHYEKRGSEEVCIDDEIPFEIPENWVWCRFEAATLYVTDYVANGSFASLRENVKTYKEENYALMVKTQDFSNDFTRGLTYTDQKGFDYLQKSRLYGGELMLSNIGASIGKAFIIPTMNIRMTLAPNAIVVKCLDTVMTEYLRYFILSYYGQKMLSDFTAGTAMPKFSKTQLRSALLPVPPYSEQKRIIEKIKQLDVLVCTL